MSAHLPVTLPDLPPLPAYTAYLADIWRSHRLTNDGPLTQQLASDLSHYLDGLSVQLTSNGTTALHLAIRALGLTGEVITTPFSFVVTTAAILWELCQPVFVDIDPLTFCLDAGRIEAAITPRTQAILATHVYGYFPVVLPSEEVLLRVQARLLAAHIASRRYLFPALNRLPYHQGASCPVAENLAGRVLCLPFFRQLTPGQVLQVARLVRAELLPAEAAEPAPLAFPYSHV